MDYASLLLRGKSSSGFKFNYFGEETASRYSAFETALSSLDFVHEKLPEAPENSPR